MHPSFKCNSLRANRFKISSWLLYKRTTQRAMALVSVVFLMIVMAGAVLMMSKLISIQNATNVLSMEAIRAQMAAYSGLEWILYQIGGGGDCTDSPFVWTMSNGDLSGFRVEVNCSSTLHSEGMGQVIIYDIQSQASKGTLGTSEHVYRELSAVVEF